MKGVEPRIIGEAERGHEPEHDEGDHRAPVADPVLPEGRQNGADDA